MATIETRVILNNYSGETVFLPGDWEDYFMGSFAQYIGRCMQQGDTVNFKGNMENGTLSVYADGERVYVGEWITDDEYEVLTDDDRIEMMMEDARELFEN